MKNLIIKLSIIAILIVACNTAMAVFTDNPEVQVLMHCDVTHTDQIGWKTTPDDNSSGRAANEPVLNKCHCPLEWNIDNATLPTLMSGSPKGGDYFSFDGIADSIYCRPGWRGGDTLVCEFSFRFRSLPVANDFMGLVSCRTFTCFLSMQGGSPHISLMVESNVMINSPTVLALDTWYDVRVTIDKNNLVSITVDGYTYTEHSAHPFPNYTDDPLIMGYHARDWNRFLDGDMDEIRIGNVPEPFTFGLIGLLGLLALRK